ERVARARPGYGGLLGERDAEALRDPPHRVRERERLGLHHECEDVAVLAAAETVKEAALLADRERRRLLGVERAETDRAPTPPAERHDVRHHLDEARALPDGSDDLVPEAAHRAPSRVRIGVLCLALLRRADRGGAPRGPDPSARRCPRSARAAA